MRNEIGISGHTFAKALQLGLKKNYEAKYLRIIMSLTETEAFINAVKKKSLEMDSFVLNDNDNEYENSDRKSVV